MPYQVKDAQLTDSKTLPSSAGAVNSTGLDTQAINAFVGERLQDCEFELVAPALNATQLPNAATATYKIQVDTVSNFGSAADLIAGAIVQTGAGGVGAATASFRFRVKSTEKRYIRAVCTTASTPGDCSASSMILRMVV